MYSAFLYILKNGINLLFAYPEFRTMQNFVIFGKNFFIENWNDPVLKHISNNFYCLAKTEHSHPLGMVVSTHFRCGKGVKRGLKNGALPFTID